MKDVKKNSKLRIDLPARTPKDLEKSEKLLRNCMSLALSPLNTSLEDDSGKKSLKGKG